MLTLSFAGAGLGLLWPLLLGFPQIRVAIISAVCVIRPKIHVQPEDKDTIPEDHDSVKEMDAVLTKFGYTKQVVLIYVHPQEG